MSMRRSPFTVKGVICVNGDWRGTCFYWRLALRAPRARGLGAWPGRNQSRLPGERTALAALGCSRRQVAKAWEPEHSQTWWNCGFGIAGVQYVWQRYEMKLDVIFLILNSFMIGCQVGAFLNSLTFI